MNREQISKAFLEWAALNEAPYAHGASFHAGWDAALRSLESAEVVVRVITGDDEKFWAGDRRAEQKRMQEQFNASFQTYASAPAASANPHDHTVRGMFNAMASQRLKEIK